ncbi:MAG: aa3-type cytochrome c oxidase subunit IV [Bauldia sp.]
MAQDIDVIPATAADIAADMDNHRRTYRGFLKLLTWVAAASAAGLVVLFLLLQSIPVNRAPGGDPPPGIAEGPPTGAPGGA